MRVITAFFVLSSILVSCTTVAEEFPTGSDSVSVSSTFTAIPETSLLPTSASLPDASSTIPLTSTPLPTLSARTAEQTFQHWLLGSPDCLLPCWGGIVPGKTKWSETLYQLRPVFQYGSIPSNGECRFGECSIWGWNYSLENDKSYDGVLFGKNDTLYAIQISGSYDTAISLKHVFETYDRPAQVFVKATSEPRGDPPRLYVTVLYPQSKFIITYMWWANLEKEEYMACGEPALFQLGIVAIDENQWLPIELAANGGQLTKQSSSIWSAQPISEVTPMTTIDFYSQMRNNPSDLCITTPAKYWP